jgi:hypothetical protein
MQFWIKFIHAAVLSGWLIFTVLSAALFKLDYMDVPRPKKALIARVCIWAVVTTAVGVLFWILPALKVGIENT